jgi:hypothetical protein
MDSTKLPLSKWSMAMYVLSQAKTGLSALALKRQLGVNCSVACLVHHKVMDQGRPPWAVAPLAATCLWPLP